MSSKKIIRLKTPLKSRQQTKLSESTQLSGVQFNQESTIMLVKNVTCSEQLQVTLINQINKLYKQMGKFKRLAQEDSQKREQVAKQNKILKSKIDVLDREYKMYKEMYDLEKDNHERLRKFYQMREKQWLCIVNQHKKILQDYDQNVTKTISNIEMKSDYSHLESMYTNLEQMLSKSFLKDFIDRKESNFPERKQRRKLRSSLDRQDSLSQPKLKLKLNSHKETSFKDTSQIQEKRQRTPLKLKHSYQSVKNSQRAQPLLQKNAQADDMFDLIVRKTYYKYKQKQISISQIEQLQDMVKLKNAKTSTKERLAKTIRKLDFQVSNQQQMKVLCECVQKNILLKYKMLRGDYAFDYLVDKLKECQKLALSSNSQLQRLDKNKSQITNQDSEIKAKCLYNDISAIGKQQSDIYRSNKTIELLLNSTIKDQKTANNKIIDQQDLSQRIKFNGNIRKNSFQTIELSGFVTHNKNNPKIQKNSQPNEAIPLS